MKQLWADGKITVEKESCVVPNTQETHLLKILLTEAPTFSYVGNGEFWIGPCASGKRRNPDFLDKTARKVILLHGEYWHPQQSAAIESADYEGKGWRVLVIWSKELQVKNRIVMLDKIRSFVSMS